jgi:hypothetical protein
MKITSIKSETVITLTITEKELAILIVAVGKVPRCEYHRDLENMSFSVYRNLEETATKLGIPEQWLKYRT